MTDKEFKRLSRAELIEIIYQLQLQIDRLTDEKKGLEAALEDKQLRISNAGSLAEAALEINDCFRNAQTAAEQYLDEIKRLRNETEAERERILTKARQEAAEVVSDAKSTAGTGGTDVEAILREISGRQAADI